MEQIPLEWNQNNINNNHKTKMKHYESLIWEAYLKNKPFINEYKPYLYIQSFPSSTHCSIFSFNILFLYDAPWSLSRFHWKGMLFEKIRSIMLSLSTALSFSQIQVEMKSIMRTSSTVLLLMNEFSIVSHIPTT